jgi:pilus assembly protein CpaB
MKSKYILIIALIMAIITTVLFRQYMISVDNKYKKTNQIVAVVVPKVDIKANQKITSEMLETKEVSSGSILTDAVKKTSDVEGKYATTDIQKGEVLYPTRYTSQYQEDKVLTRKITDGYRAVSIGVTDVKSVNKMIEPEDRVDVVYTLNGQSSVILENVRVLAVGTQLANTEANNTTSSDKASEDYVTITVELSPADVVKLVNADETGEIKFVLRGELAS